MTKRKKKKLEIIDVSSLRYRVTCHNTLFGSSHSFLAMSVEFNHQSIHFLPLILLGVVGGLDPISASSGEGRVTLDKSSVHCGADI